MATIDFFGGGVLSPATPSYQDGYDQQNFVPQVNTNTTTVSAGRKMPTTSLDSCASSGNGGFLLVFIVIIVFIVIGAVLYYFNQQKTDSSDSKPQSSGRYGAAVVSQPTAAPASPKGLVVVNDQPLWSQTAAPGSDRVVAFTMEGCGHCHNMMPALNQAGMSSTTPIYNLHFSGEQWKQQIVQGLGFGAFPTIMRYRGNESVSRGAGVEFQGPRTAEALKKFAETGSS